MTPLVELVSPDRPKIKPSDRPELAFIGMQHIESNTMKLLGTVSASEMKSNAVHFQPGDVLYGRLRPYLNKVFRPIFEGLCSAEFIVMPENDKIDGKYLQYFLNSARFVSFASHLKEGDRPRVNFKLLSPYKVPLPPTIDDQHRIVAEIEKQFSRLDKAVASLKRVKTSLKRYKAAVLKAAVEGKLTEEWRKQNPDVEPASKLLERILAERRTKWEEAELAKMKSKGQEPKNEKWTKRYKELKPVSQEGLPEIPESWIWVKLPQVGELNRGKSKHRPRNDPVLYDGPYPFVQTGDIRKAIGALTEYSQTYSEQGLSQSRLWQPGALCITIAANIADTAILGLEACFPDSIVGFIPESPELDVRFYEYFIRTAKEDLDRFAPATAQKNINLGILSEVAVPFPSAKEQEAIVGEIESRLSVVHNIDVFIETELVRTERLQQSVLRAAFTGCLIRALITETTEDKLDCLVCK